ncbi:hypothetical protein [Dyella caseinilytica]|uniref:Uncharacterized protein n=1 Tax=Dyella caseinilytica TaxID=1849581 RepID=A0ABX7GQB5_9GAMM|nr:hypothetical protein [Dyella caseinilytica]QRN52104.1 hypothetical protein ISN74_11385 [Dyella caseinilytica]GGA15358.1 hypothetical protein GCM10011408_41650 [Dyella caseinilytica]
MTTTSSYRFRRWHAVTALAVTALAAGVAAYANDFSQDRDFHFWPGNLVVSRSVYDNNASNVQIGELLPPNCPTSSGACGAAPGAQYDGTYPYVFNNDIYDGSFGITSRIYLDQMTTNGWVINSLEVPNSLRPAAREGELVTSFSSKSELGLHLSLDGRYLTFMGYVAPVNALDVSNSNTPLAVDPTNPDGGSYYRAVALVDGAGHFQFTETNGYSGNNGRAAIYNNVHGANVFYTSGNGGNGSNPQPVGVIQGTGAQWIVPSNLPEALQTPAATTPLASFSVTALGDKADKVGKDDNFRGMTVYNNVVYYTKGSGSNGVNTVYFVDTTGTACPNGVGVPVSGAALPSSSLAFNAATLQKDGLPTNMCILAGFPSTPVKTATTVSYPFSIWFADANTLYVADEGDGYVGGTDLYTHAAAQTTAGLQKWVFDATTKTWNLAYTLQTGLNIGQPYTVRDYPTGTNTATNLPWAPATDGLRQITGRVDQDGKVTIWAVTSTISGGGDTGADPDKLVAIRDVLSNTTAADVANEHFVTLRSAKFGEVLRGVSFTPGTDLHEGWH